MDKVDPMWAAHLQLMYDRMLGIHHEDKNLDYMVAFKKIIDALK